MKKIAGGVLFLLTGAVLAAPPPVGVDPGNVNGFCRVNSQAMAGRQKALRAARAPGALPLPTFPAAPKVIVVRVQFTGSSPMVASLPTTQAFFSDVRDYFIENSYGVFQPTFTVSNLYTLPGNESTYGADCGTDVACGVPALFSAMLTASDGDINYSLYDHIMIYHAGNGQETCPTNGGCTSELWSLYYDENRTADLKTFQGFTIVPETEHGSYEALGVICHEYGHQLGLPDLYDVSVSGGRSTVGAWDLMDYPYTDFGSTPPHLGAWSKYFLGFSQTSTSSGTVTMSPAATTRTAFNKIPSPDPSDFFLLEYRWNGAAVYDSMQPVSAGLAVWHIDESITGNTTLMQGNLVNAASLNGRGRRGVDLVEADGIPSGGTDFGYNDLFTNGATLQSEQTNAFSGTPSGLVVSVSGGAGTSQLTTQVVYFRSAPSVNITKLINYPNPGGRHPVRAGAPQGTVTTLVVQLARPINTSKLSMDIYDFDGNRVRALAGSSFTLKAGNGEPTADEKWVYECDWDGADDNGKDLPGGVYFTRVTADGQVKKGKLALLR